MPFLQVCNNIKVHISLIQSQVLIMYIIVVHVVRLFPMVGIELTTYLQADLPVAKIDGRMDGNHGQKYIRMSPSLEP